MSTDFPQDGTPAWVELSTPDAEASKRFYQELFGWTYVDAAGGRSETVVALLDGRHAAAITSAPEVRRGGWTTFITAADAEKTVEAVTAAGGEVLAGPAPVGPTGRAVILADQAGTRFGVWTPGGEPELRICDVPGSYHAGELITDDVPATAAFYGKVFGWVLGEPYGPLNRRDLLLDGRAVSVLLPRPPAMSAEVRPYWDVLFTVVDAAQTAETARKLGATELMPATATDHGTIAVLADPTGAVFTVLAPTTH